MHLARDKAETSVKYSSALRLFHPTIFPIQIITERIELILCQQQRKIKTRSEATQTLKVKCLHCLHGSITPTSEHFTKN